VLYVHSTVQLSSYTHCTYTYSKVCNDAKLLNDTNSCIECLDLLMISKLVAIDIDGVLVGGNTVIQGAIYYREIASLTYSSQMVVVP
jgi:hypothetical protein